MTTLSLFLELDVRESIILLICNFISNRQQSDFKVLNGGLPQGTKFGPLGFQCFINDAASDASVSVWKYKDDLTMAENCLCSEKGNLQADLDKFVDWTKNNNLILNPSKCQALPVCFKRDPPQPALTI